MSTFFGEVHFCECPHCKANVKASNTNLFYGENFNLEVQEVYDGHIEELRDRQSQLKEQRSRMQSSSQVGAASVNLGFLFEKIAPSLKGFPVKKADIRFIADPIDFIAFEGLSSGSVSNVIFGDIKSGNARLTQKQKAIKELVEKGKVDLEVY